MMRSCRRAALLVCLLGVPSWGADTAVVYLQDLLDGKAQREAFTYRKVGGTALHLYVYRPAGKGTDRAAVVLIHGGGWGICRVRRRWRCVRGSRSAR